MRWRRLGVEDAADMAALLVEAYRRSLAAGVEFAAARATPPDVEAALRAGVALLAMRDPQTGLVAAGGVWPDGELAWLAVANRAVGRGMGSTLLNALEGLAYALGHDRVYLRTASSHPWLAAWHRRRGYRQAPGAAVGVCDLRLERVLHGDWQPPAGPRCPWAASDARLAAYHDFEWGLWVEGEQDLFERLSLEVFQTGLSWRTVLVKRAALRDGLVGLRPERLAAATDADLEAFLRTPGVIRSPRKFWATVHNARAVRALGEEHGSLAAYLRGRPTADLYAELRPRLRYFGPSVAQSFFESVGVTAAPHASGCTLLA